jgi:hypothetical protein
MTMLCTLCLSDKHVAASCPKRPRWFDRVLAMIAAIVIVGGWVVQTLRQTGG